MLKWISVTKYGALFGLLLLAIDFFWVRKSDKSHEKEVDALNHELQTLKAKMVDLQGNAKVRPAGSVEPNK